MHVPWGQNLSHRTSHAFAVRPRSGNKYGVSDDFHRMNGQLLMHEVERSAWFNALTAADQARAGEFLKTVLFDSELRNRTRCTRV